MDRAKVLALRAACQSASHQDFDEFNDSIFLAIDEVSEVVCSLLSLERDQVTSDTVKAACLGMRTFLPGLQSGYFTPQEVAIITESHRSTQLNQTKVIPQDSQEKVEAPQKPLQIENEPPPEPKIQSYRLANPQTILPSTSGRLVVLLPTRSYYLTHPLPSTAEISRLFARLDISGDGRLTFLNLKSALEFLSEELPSSQQQWDDVFIRSWLRDHDRGLKGYVDFDDFAAIFQGTRSRSSETPQYRLSGMEKAKDKAPTKPDPYVDYERLSRIRRFISLIFFIMLSRTFSKYDTNQDGYIDADDLSKAFLAMGRQVKKEEIVEWVRKRDSKGIGAVCFEDFLAHYA